MIECIRPEWLLVDPPPGWQNRPVHVRVALMLAVCAAACSEKEAARGPQAKGNRADSAPLFAADGVPAIEITLDRGAMAELAREPRDSVRGGFRLRGAKQPRHDDVALRFKGHRSLRGWAQKPAFKLDFDKHQKDRRVLGMSGLVLNNMVDDPTMLRENLASQVYAALGVPAPRVGYAELFVNGERFGLYSVLEPIDERFLARELGTGDGPLYEGDYGCDVFEADVWGFGHESGDDPEREHLLALARSVEKPPSHWLFGRERLVEPRRFLAFLAAAALLSDFDGYRHAHNYRLYLDSSSQTWSLLPWGFDRVMKQRLAPFDSNGRLARSCFADAPCRLEYVKALQDAVDRFAGLGLERRMDALAARIAGAAARDRRRPYDDEKRALAVAGLRAFIRERPGELRAQLGCWDGARERDADGDGAGCMDCDDGDATIAPGATERCDGRDDDCSGLIDDAPSCPCRETAVDGARFALCDLPMSFWDARAFCAARGQVLARVDSKAQAKALALAAEQVREGEWWIGLDDLAREGRYRFLDGTKPLRSLWGKGEPDPYACGEHCAAFREDGRGRLRDLHCATRLPFVCSEPPPATP